MAALRLGLTGGIGSGKSTVARLLLERGAVLIDADAISRAATAPGGKAITPIAEAFGPETIDATGALNRDAMRNRIFTDPSAKTRLEGIIHPLVGVEIATQAQRADTTGAACIVFDIPLLVESRHWRKSLGHILVVDCLESTQVTRVVSRNGLAPAEVETIIRVQATRAQRLAAADTVVFNDGITLDALARLVAEIAPQFGL